MVYPAALREFLFEILEAVIKMLLQSDGPFGSIRNRLDMIGEISSIDGKKRNYAANRTCCVKKILRFRFPLRGFKDAQRTGIMSNPIAVSHSTPIF